ncbi:hypothetical protein GYH30_014469 [Glycine max]|nr:hypothetical protein GYH30_014469 [Glycine max]
MASSLMLPAASMLRPCTTLSSSCASSRRLALFHLVSTGGIALPQAQLFGAEKLAQPEKNLFDWVKNDNRRFLHVVYRVGDLEKTIKFYTECLGMKLLRKRDIPEDRYSNAFLGYGPEESNFTVELTYSEFQT